MEIRREKIMKFLSYSSSGGYCPSRWMEVCTSMHTAVYRGTCDAFVCVSVSKCFVCSRVALFGAVCVGVVKPSSITDVKGGSAGQRELCHRRAGLSQPVDRVLAFHFSPSFPPSLRFAPSLLPRSSTIWDTLIVSSKREGERERERKDNPPSSIVTRFHLFLWGEEQGSGGARGEEGSKNKFWWAEVVLLHRWEHDASLLGFECIYAHTDMLALTAVRTDFLHFLILPS